MARLVFLGRLEDLAGSAEMEADASTLAEALERLPQALFDQIANGKVRFALNGAVLGKGVEAAGVPLREGDEVALLPPVSGG